MSTETENHLETTAGLHTGEAVAIPVKESTDGGDHLKTVALRTYGGHKTRRIGDAEILELLPLVHSIARRAVGYVKPPLSIDDLVRPGQWDC